VRFIHFQRLLAFRGDTLSLLSAVFCVAITVGLGILLAILSEPGADVGAGFVPHSLLIAPFFVMRRLGAGGKKCSWDPNYGLF